MAKTWQQPVNMLRHKELISQGFKFVDSHWENEFAVSKYQRGDRVIRVEEKGRILEGD